MRADPRRGGNICEGAVAIVQEELVWERLVKLGMAVFRLAFPLAVRLLVDVPTHVVHDEKIQEAVVVDVDPSRADGPQRPVLLIRLRESSFLGDVREGAVAIVVVERVAMDAAVKDIFVAVVIVIADGDADVVARSSKPGLFGYVGERAVSVVSE